jgi:hypothetical protein
MRLVYRIVCVVMLGVVAVAAASCGRGGNTAKAENVVQSMAKGDYVGATRDFDAKMKSVMTPAKAERVWSMIAKQGGAFKSISGTRVSKEQGMDIVCVACQLEKSILDVKIVFNGGGQISGLWIVPHQ